MAFTHYKSVTIDHTQCGASNSTDFPVSIWITDADFAAVAFGGKSQNAFGFDIRPYPNTVPSSALTFELVPGTYVATTGTFEMHVKLPTVNHSTNTVFYLFVGDAVLTTDGSSTATWDSHYLLVNHFANGSALSLADSSQSPTTGTGVNTPTATTGEIDGAMALASAGPSSATWNASKLNSYTALTVSCWFNASSLPSEYNTIFSKTGGGNYALVYYRSSTSGFAVYIAAAGGSINNDPNTDGLSTGTTYALTTVYDSTVGNLIYLNGSEQTGDAHPPNGDAVPATGDLEMGNDPGTGGRNWDGWFDELRFSDIVRSEDWILTEYNNQKPSSTFLSFGSLTPVGGGATPTTRLPLLGVG